jgi:hypothetical protein
MVPKMVPKHHHKIAASTPIKVPEIHGIIPSKSHVGE